MRIRGLVIAIFIFAGVAFAAPVSVRSTLLDDIAQIEREIAQRMMQRPHVNGDRKTRLEAEIDLRIIARGVAAFAAEGKPESEQQIAGWMRTKHVLAAIRGIDDALAQSSDAPTESQKQAMAAINKMSFGLDKMKEPRELDDFCEKLALAMVNAVNATPVEAKVIAVMRPKPIRREERPTDRPASVAELTEQVQRLAAISVPLRQQLLALASSAGAEKEPGALYGLLNQTVGLARGLQSNTAVSAEARTAIEAQMAEGIALFTDERTRSAGKARIDALSQYRQILSRVGKMPLSREQMDQLGPSLAWAQANPEGGARLLAAIEKYLEISQRWDSQPRETLATLKRSMDDLVLQFQRARPVFMQDAAKIGGAGLGSGLSELEAQADELARILHTASDIAQVGKSLELLNAYKVRPIGGLDKKVITAAIAAGSATKDQKRGEAETYLESVNQLAAYSQRFAARPLINGVDASIAQTWAGGKLSGYETKWQAIVVDLISGLMAGSLELDKTKAARLDAAIALGDALRSCAELEANLAKAPALSRWVDWGVDPAVLSALIAPYRESMASAFAGFASDIDQPVERWKALLPRYLPVITLINRNATYAEQCVTLPIGLAGDIGRLHTRIDDAPFATERFAAYAMQSWLMSERGGDAEGTERIASALSRRLAREFNLPVAIEGPRPRRRGN